MFSLSNPKNLKRVELAHLPTPVIKLKRLSNQLNQSIYMKRDDMTGTELSGNKVRKLEYALSEALSLGAKVVITCGSIQSNHARATAAAARSLGLDVHLVLASGNDPVLEGNYLLDRIFGAEITLLSPDDFSRHGQVMTDLKEKYDAQGTPAYILPLGASNAIGNFGYCHAFSEILAQEKATGLTFDTIVCTVGSGGTYAGLFLGNYLYASKRKIIGINISADAPYFQKIIAKSVTESLHMLNQEKIIPPEAITIIDGYAGRGYALSQKEEIEFICDFAKKEGILLDPVYTGKAMRGLVAEIEKGTLKDSQNILFIHTGGMLGFVPHYLTDLSSASQTTL